MNDTGLMISHAFDERGIVSEQLYQKILKDKLEINAGMLMENIVAQMLTAIGCKLFFYSNASRVKEDRTTVDNKRLINGLVLTGFVILQR